MLKPFTYALFILLGLAIAAPESRLVAVTIGIEQAQAQKKKRKTLFDVLFKRREKKRKSATRKKIRPERGLSSTRKKKKTRSALRQQNTTKRKKKRTSSSGTAKVRKPAVVVVKNENAAKILVVGDFMAGGIARGLEREYSDEANLIIVNRSKPDSGIVRDDVRDWANIIPDMIEEVKPVAVIALVGMNDRQQMRLETGRVEKLSEEWTTEYKTRIGKIATSTATAKIPFLWVGLPPVKFGKMNTDYLTFNEMYRIATETTGGTFVDVWDGFTNAEGKFVSAGPDINGQIVRLRGSKGITMTRAGRQKLAFFADKALRKIGIVGNPEGFEYATLGTVNTGAALPSIPEYDPAKSGKTVVISLGSPALDGGDKLEGEKDFLKNTDDNKSVSFDLVEKGELRASQPGRIDASWGISKQIAKSSETADKDTKPTPPAATAGEPAAVTVN